MEKTANYQLPQWEANDPVRREDFNQAMESIDAGIQAAACVIGSYTGNGVTAAEGGQLIELGFRPRFVIITRGWAGTSSPSSFLAVGEPRQSNQSLIYEPRDNGFVVYHVNASGVRVLNTDGDLYDYVAFR